MFVHYIIFTGMVQSKKGKTRWMAPKECKYVWKKCLRRGKLTWPISTTLPKSMVSVGYGSFFVLHLVSRLPSTQLSGPNFFFFVLDIVTDTGLIASPSEQARGNWYQNGKQCETMWDNVRQCVKLPSDDWEFLFWSQSNLLSVYLQIYLKWTEWWN